MKNFRRHAAMLSFLLITTGLLATSAHALSYVGTFATDSSQYTLVRAGDQPGAIDDPADWLRFDPNQTFLFDITGNVLTASGPQIFTLQSTGGATATFTIIDLMLDLSGPNGLAGGFLDYQLDSITGTFTFIEQTYGLSGFNSSSFSGSVFTALVWGGDSTNFLGFDGGIIGSPVPLPGAIVLFASALSMLVRRRKNGP